MLAAVEWSRGIEDAWSDVAAFVPKFLGFLAILVIGYVVVKAIAKVADSILERVGFDDAVERGGIRRAMARSKYDASDVVSKLVFYGLFLLVLQMAFGVFGTNPVSDLLEGVIAYVPKVLAAIVIVVIASAVGAAAHEMIDAALGGLEYGRTLARAAAVGIVTVGVFMALNQLEIAPAIVNGLFYAILAVVVGSAIIAIGGGGIQAMRQRWDRALDRYDTEKDRIREQSRGAGDRMRARAQARADLARSNVSGDATADLASPRPMDPVSPDRPLRGDY